MQDFKDYELRYKVSKNKIRAYRYTVLGLLLIALISDVYTMGVYLAFNILKFFTFWGFIMAIIFFIHILRDEIKHEPCKDTMHVFQIVCTCHIVIFTVFWLVLFPTQFGGDKFKWQAISQNIFLHLIVQLFLLIEFFINNKVFVYNKYTFKVLILIIVAYSITNFTLAKAFQVYPYKIIKWELWWQYLIGFGLIGYGIGVYFLLLKSNHLKLRKKKQTYLIEEDLV